MIDKRQVMYDIERCVSHVPDACRDCSHYTGTVGFECMENLISDAHALLKEQEAVETKPGKWIYGEDETGADGWRCSECGFFEPWFYEFTDDIDFIRFYGFCPGCGRKMASYTGKPTQECR